VVRFPFGDVIDTGVDLIGGSSMPREDTTANSNRENTDQNTGLNGGRRSLLKAVGTGAMLALVSGVGSAQSGNESRENEHTNSAERDCPDTPCLDPAFGYASLSADVTLPPPLEADHAVDMLIQEPATRPGGPPDPNVDFFFEPVGLHVEPGDIVRFNGTTPEHTVTAYHSRQGRQQRVPVGVPPFSSPVLAAGGFWLYAFEESGVYDLFCAPHESFGMVMRIVVGEDTEPVVRKPGRPPLEFAGAVLDQDELCPVNIVEEGSVSWVGLFS
jgi:plastocyanin